MQLLMSLNGSYAAMRGQNLMIEPLPTVSRFFNLLIQEERQRSIGHPPPLPSNSSSTDAHTFHYNTNPSSPMVVAIATNFGKPKKDKPLCTHYGLTGHTVDKCYKLHGYPPSYQLRSRGLAPQFAQLHQSSIQSKSPLANHVASEPALMAGQHPGSLSLAQCQQLISYLST